MLYRANEDKQKQQNKAILYLSGFLGYNNKEKEHVYTSERKILVLTGLFPNYKKIKGKSMFKR